LIFAYGKDHTMAITAVTQNAVLPGDACVLAINWIFANQGAAQATDFAIGWVAGSSPAGGYFQVSMRNKASTVVATSKFFANGAQTGAKIPVKLIVLYDAWTRPFSTQWDETSDLTLDIIVHNFASARAQCLIDICGATVNSLGTQTFTFSGRTRPALAYNVSLVSDSTDLALDIYALQDVRIWATSQDGNFNSSWPTYGGSISMGPVSVAGGSSDALPLDLDVGINNGANIFSVMSRTFTEPGT